jgi:hypothetical protein
MRDRSGRRGYGIHLAVAFFVALLANAALAPPAQAGCGDATVTADQMHTVLPSQHAGVLSEPGEALPVRPHKPCSGPLCRHSPVLPPSVPAPSLTPTIQEWSCSSAPLAFMPIAGLNHAIEEVAPAPIFGSRDIFHPPR